MSTNIIFLLYCGGWAFGLCRVKLLLESCGHDFMSEDGFKFKGPQRWRLDGCLVRHHSRGFDSSSRVKLLLESCGHDFMSEDGFKFKGPQRWRLDGCLVRHHSSCRVTKINKGPNLKLSFSLTIHFDQYVKSEYFKIADLAMVRLEFRQTQRLCKCHDVYISSMKQESSKNSKIRMNVTSEQLNCSQQLYCSDNWSHWVLLGERQATPLKYNSGTVYVSMVDVNICVYEENEPAKLNVDPDLTDFQLTTTDGSVAVHKACLAACSSVFETMFSGNWKETIEGSMELKDFTGKTLQDFKDFIYSGILPDDGLRPLILLAKRFLIADLIAACAKKLAETVSPENFYSLNDLACHNNIPELTSAIIELTPDAVVNDAYLLKNKDKPAAPGKTNTE